MGARIAMTHIDYEPANLLGNLNESENKNLPKRLYTAGDIKLLERSPRIAVIGSRKASTEAIQKAEVVARVQAPLPADRIRMGHQQL